MLQKWVFGGFFVVGGGDGGFVFPIKKRHFPDKCFIWERLP